VRLGHIHTLLNLYSTHLGTCGFHT